MSDKKLSRRDFLKLGGLAAVSLPVASKVGELNGQDLYKSEALYGGFLVQRLKEDEPSIVVDETNYQRFDATYGIFSRNVWDDEYVDRTAAVEKVYAPNQPGYEWIDTALNSGAFV